MNSRLRNRVIAGSAILLSTLAGLFVLEVTLRLFAYKDAWLQRMCLQTHHSKYWTGQCAGRLNVPLVPFFPGNLFLADTSYPQIDGKEVLPLSGLPHQNTLFCREEGPWETFLADEMGFSNPLGTWNQKRWKAVLAGDSFVLGECRPAHERFASLVQSRVNAVANLGYSGSGPLATLARLREFAWKRRPAQVLYFYYEGNDLTEAKMEHAARFYRRYLEDPAFTQKLEDRAPQVHRAIETFFSTAVTATTQAMGSLTFDLNWLKLATLRTALRQTQAPAAPQLPPPPALDPQAVAILDQSWKVLSREAKDAGSRVTVFVLPSIWVPESAPRPDYAGLAAKHGFKLVHTKEAFAARKITPYTQKEPYHYTAEANRVLADLILKELGAEALASPVL